MENCPNCGEPLVNQNHGYEVQFAALADAVNMSQEGKLNIAGEFDVIWSEQEPVRWLSMYFVAKLKVGAAAGPEISIDLSIVDDDQQLLIQTLHLTGPRPDSLVPGYPGTIPVVLPIMQAEFPKFGTYHFQLYGGGHLLKAVPLHIMKRPTPQ